MILFWRHILLVVRKCPILCQIIVICGKCWFSSSIRRKRRLKHIESSKKFTEMLLWVKQRAVIGSVASKTVISMLMTVCVKESQKPSKTLMLFIMSCWNRTKPSLGNGIERNWSVWAEHWAKNGHNTSRGTKKWFYSMTTLGLTLPNPLKPTWKHSNGKFRSYEDIEKCLDSWLASKDEHFYRNGIRALPER